MEVQQKYLKKTGLIALIAVMNMVVPLSLDMYLPAVPQMTQVFNTSESVVNITLVGFFFFMAVGILLFGPLSDKYGRKPMLMAGTCIYMIFSGACALAPSVGFLIGSRIIQALGAGCMVAVSTALIKDCFERQTRDVVLAVVQAMAVIAPMVAPVAGAWIVTLSGWRATFWLLAIIALLCLVAVASLQETLPSEERESISVLKSLGGLIKVGKNPGFSLFLLSVGVLSAPYMAYISVCSYIYIDFFALSETTYSYYFAINSAASILGPLLYLKVTKRIGGISFMNAAVIISIVCGFMLVFFGSVAPIIFLLCFIPFTVMESAVRPFSTAILLNQQERDTGSASALINFTHTALGSFGMLLGAAGWSSFILGLGIILAGGAVLALLAWLILLKSGIRIKGIKD